MTNRQIAKRLTISEKTAEGHVGNILAKLSCSSRTKAAELARATGLLEGSAA
jgi:DNA-binding NarL/FixJ family response regulator